MTVLLWISVFLLLVGLTFYLIWSFRESEIPARWIRVTFFGGALAFIALFIAFTWHTMLVMHRATHADQLTASVRAGKVAWQKYLCVDCHTILGNGAYYATDLTRAWNRFLDRAGGDPKVARASMIAFLRNPPQATSSRRGMPDVVSDADAASLADFLQWTSAIETNGWPPEPKRKLATLVPLARQPVHSRGEQLFAESGCPACHSIGGGPVVGPDLAGVGRRYDAETLAQWIRDPQTLYARLGTPVNKGFPEMPALGLSATEAKLIAEYLSMAGGAQ